MDDRETIQAVRRGDDEAFRALVEKYQARVYRTVREFVFDHQDAEDVTQETFVRAFRHMDRFDLGRAFLPWILTIAKNLAINHGKRRREVAVETVSEDPDGTDSPQEQAVQVRDMAERIERAAKGLPDRYRAVFQLFYRDELSVSQIAERLSVPEGTVKSDLFRARAMIRQAVETPAPQEAPS